MAILYVETSLAMSIAMGRDPEALPLLHNFPAGHTLALPAACLMESLSAFQRERSNYNDFANRLRSQANQLLRDRSSPAAVAMIAHLYQADLEIARLQNDIQSRLVMALEELLRRAILIPMDGPVVASSLQSQPVRQLTDNLILHTVLSHAAAQGPAQLKALLTGNTNDFDQPQVRALLASAGVTDVWATAGEAASWLARTP